MRLPAARLGYLCLFPFSVGCVEVLIDRFELAYRCTEIQAG